MIMPNRIINFCYNIAAKHEIKKKLKEDGQYVALPPTGATDVNYKISDDEDSDASTKSPTKKRVLLNKMFKRKTKNSGEGSGSVSMRKTYAMKNSAQNFGEYSEIYEVASPVKEVTIRKKKRTLAFYDKMAGHNKKHPGWAKIRPTPDIPVADMEKQIQIVEETSSSNDSLVESSPKPVVTLTTDKDHILQEFDPLWTSKADKPKSEGSSLAEILKIPVKLPRNKIIYDKLKQAKKMAAMKLPELKMATLEAIQEYDLLEEQAVDDETGPISGSLPVKAKVSFEGDFEKLIIHNKSTDINEDKIPKVQYSLDNQAVPLDLANASYAELQPVFTQPCKEPKVDEMLTDFDKLKLQGNDFSTNAIEGGSADDKHLLVQPLQADEQQALQIYQEEEENNRKIIADFFAEQARSINDDDIANYTNNIEICKIEIYEEDIKRYHEALKYSCGTGNFDVMYATVETALNFIEKLVKERDQKKKLGFFPDLIDRRLKNKAKKDDEDKKKKEEKKKKKPSKPKMFLVYNKYNKEKVIICTPGEFYDSE